MQATAAPVSDLGEEISRYLALVDALREEGLEPQWLPERASEVAGTAQGWQPDGVSSG